MYGEKTPGKAACVQCIHSVCGVSLNPLNYGIKDQKKTTRRECSPGGLYQSVPKEGIEPSFLTEHDFESCASAYSATSARTIHKVKAPKIPTQLLEDSHHQTRERICPLAPLAAIHTVVDRAGILDAQLASHDGRVARAASCGKIKNRPLYGIRNPTAGSGN